MKISLISASTGHGKILNDSGTGLAILLSKMPEVENVDLITWEKDSQESIILPEKVRIYPLVP